MQGTVESEGKAGDEMRASREDARAEGQKVRGTRTSGAPASRSETQSLWERLKHRSRLVFVRSEFAQPTGGCVGGALFV